MAFRRRMLKVALIAIGAVVLVALVGLVAVNLMYSKVPENMAAIAKYMPQLESTLRSDSRFHGVSTWFDTSHMGSITIDGEVDGEQELLDLKALVDATRPPRPVFWHVTVHDAQR